MHDRLLLFMIQVLVVLALARTLGELSRRLKQPALAGEILAGVVLGKSVLGNISPSLFARLFPHDELQQAMFGVTAELGILFLLLVVGLEVNVVAAWRMRRQTAAVAIAGVLVPLALGAGVAWLMYDSWIETPVARLPFALLVGAGVAITAITVVARLLFDLDLIRSDLGLFLVSAMALNELFGWIVLAVVLGLVGASGSAGVDVAGLATTVGGVVILAAFCLTIGRHLTTRAMLWLERKRFPNPAVPLSVVVCLGLLGGAVASALGIHPVFGFLLAGVMAGDPRALSEHTKSIISQMVGAIFVPLFFAGICIEVDFVSHFDATTVVAVTILSIAGKFFGAWLGTLAVSALRTNRIAIAVAHIPGGPMGVLLATVAREVGVIGPQMFVALVVASIVSALLVGPFFTRALARRQDADVVSPFSQDRVVSQLAAATRDDAIAQLVARAGYNADEAEIIGAVLARESLMGTGLGRGIAVPHARLDDLDASLVVVGTSLKGIDWNAIDGRPVHLIFLVLTPADDVDTQLAILATIAEVCASDEARRELVDAETADAAWSQLERRLEQHRVEHLEPGQGL